MQTPGIVPLASSWWEVIGATSNEHYRRIALLITPHKFFVPCAFSMDLLCITPQSFFRPQISNLLTKKKSSWNITYCRWNPARSCQTQGSGSDCWQKTPPTHSSVWNKKRREWASRRCTITTVCLLFCFFSTVFWKKNRFAIRLLQEQGVETQKELYPHSLFLHTLKKPNGETLDFFKKKKTTTVWFMYAGEAAAIVFFKLLHLITLTRTSK